MSLNLGVQNRRLPLITTQGPIEVVSDDLVIGFAAFLGVWLGIPRA